MKKRKITYLIAAIVVIVVLIIAAVTGPNLGSVKECYDCHATGMIDGVACETCGGEGSFDAGSNYYQTFWAFIPAIIAIALALITKEVYSSLFIGVIVGALLSSNFKFAGTVDRVISDGVIAAVADSAGIFVFLVVLGIIVALINKAGGSAAFGRWAKKNIHTRTGAMLATFILGILIFIDDYFNCLTVGSVMRPVTDSKNISRAKLSFLVDATAAPICMIAPVSSWAAAVAQYAEDGRGLQLFITAIPYNFYSLLTLVFVLMLILLKFDFGPMRKHELNAIQNGDLFSGAFVDADDKHNDDEILGNPKGKVIDIILPVVILIICSIIGLLYVGGMFDGLGFIDAFANTDAYVGLPWGGVIALVITIIYLIARGVVSFEEAMKCFPKGFIAMVPALTILTFATALKNITGLICAKYFIAALMEGAAANLVALLPAIIFIVACVLAFATGTSWGTFGILIPIVTSIFTTPETAELLIIGMSACLAGAVCGDHCSPISDTTIMSSAGAQCNHVAHVATQIPYAVTVAIVSFVMYIITGFVQSWYICLPIGIVVMVVLMFVMRAIVNKKNA